MPCDPKPGLWAYLVCALSALLAHPLQLAASALLLGAAVTAVLLARRRADHRPIAWALGAVFVADLVGVLVAPALATPGPYEGWQRVVFHLDEARFLVWFAAVQVAVGLSFIDAMSHDTAAAMLRLSLRPFYALMVAILVACYPGLRGPSLGRFYACLDVFVILWSLRVVAVWAVHRKPSILQVCNSLEEETCEPLFTPSRVVASLLIVLCALSAVAGPWWREFFGAAWDSERVVLCALYAGIVGVQAWGIRAFDSVCGAEVTEAHSKR